MRGAVAGRVGNVGGYSRNSSSRQRAPVPLRFSKGGNVNELTHDRKRRYQNYQHMMTRAGQDAWADAMMGLMEMVGRLEADNADLRAKLDAVPVAEMALLLWGDAAQPGYVDAVGKVGDWLVEEQDAANAEAEMRAPTYNGGCW